MTVLLLTFLQSPVLYRMPPCRSSPGMPGGSWRVIQDKEDEWIAIEERVWV